MGSKHGCRMKVLKHRLCKKLVDYLTHSPQILQVIKLTESQKSVCFCIKKKSVFVVAFFSFHSRTFKKKKKRRRLKLWLISCELSQEGDNQKLNFFPKSATLSFHSSKGSTLKLESQCTAKGMGGICLYISHPLMYLCCSTIKL